MSKLFVKRKTDFKELTYDASIVNEAQLSTPAYHSDRCIHQLQENSLVLRLPKGFCSFNDVLSVKVKMEQHSKSNLKVKVRLIEISSHEDCLVVVTISDTTQKEWLKFLKNFSKRQSEITHVVKKVNDN